MSGGVLDGYLIDIVLRMATKHTDGMTNINRFSLRRQRLDHAFLADRLRGAKSYNRIAGYFRSSIFELVGEEIASIPKGRIVCKKMGSALDIGHLKA